MKKGFITAYSIAAFAVLAAAVLWFSISVFSEANRGKNEADRTFSWLCREASQNAYSLGFLTDAYIERFTDVCRGINTLIAVTITTPNGTVYAWPENSEALGYSPESGPVLRQNSLFSRILTANADMGANASPAIRITAAIRILSSGAVFSASRNAFILIFLVLISSIVVLLAASGTRPAETNKNTDDGGFDLLFPENPAAPDSSAQSAGIAETAAAEESAGSGARSATAAEYEHSWQDFPAAEETADIQPQELPHPPQGEESSGQPAGLFSPVSGFGWEQYLNERLEAELVRAASSEQDVSLLVLRIFGLSRSNSLFSRVAGILTSEFQCRDMIFEYGDDACACIIPSATLDETMQTAERLYADVRTALEGTGCKICIGISTRMTRILPASRMLEEADTAARKAEEEERLPIVAFRANPDKYRDYVLRNTDRNPQAQQEPEDN